MDAISYSYADKQAKRIKKFIENPDSTSGVLTQPSVIQAGETVTVPTGRTAILANTQIDGTLTVDGTVFIPSGATTTDIDTKLSTKVDKVTSIDNAIARFDGTTGKLQNSGVTIDDSGNVGIGKTPSPWRSDINVVENVAGTFASIGSTNSALVQNATLTATGWIRNSGLPCSVYEQTAGGHYWSSAPVGASGAAITLSNNMILDASGNLLVGTPSGGTHTIQKSTPEDGAILYLYGYNAQYSVVFTRADGIGHNGSSTALRIQKNSSTNRSINAAGTINASGADYAEYEYSNDITLAKGQIVGFKADGTLTDKYNEAVRFAIKSTNPSIVGGDVWGGESIVGKRPEQPVRKLAKTEQVQIDGSEEFETVVIEAGDTDAEWEAIEAQYKIDLADFEARLEVERQKVDRIAYAGKVPVNVYGATAGQYIVAIEKDGGIDGLAVNKADMTFARYQDTVGRVNKILDDGRAEVAVIIH